MKSTKRIQGKDLHVSEPSIEPTSYEKGVAKSFGLKVWEYNLWRLMEHLESAMKRQDDYDWVRIAYGIEGAPPSELDAFWLAKQKEYADELGQFIASELRQLNYQILRIAAEGWENLLSGKPFKNQAGRAMNRNCVWEAWHELAFHEPYPPSLDELLAWLADQNPPVKMTKGRLSKVLHEIGLGGRPRDTRLAKNRVKKAE